MHIAFVYGRGSELRPAAGTDRASGGTVTALFELSTRLAERGHEIDVFGRCDEPGLHREVRYHDRGALAAFGERRQPDALVMCHEPTRAHMRGLPHYKLPDLQLCIERNVEAARLTNPAASCVGVSVNTEALDPAAARDYLRRTEDQLGLPTIDPVRTGVGAIVDRLPG